MKEVKISVLNLQNNCYVAVPSAHRKYLIFLSNTAFKKNKVIVSMIKLMTENDKEISMPMDQWLSYVDHIYQVDKNGILTHSEINDHVSMGSFIHHTAKTGAIDYDSDDEDDGEVPNITVENPEMAKLYNSKRQAAIGASESTFTYSIVYYFALFNAYTTLYLNTQTGSTTENLNTLNYITATATDAFAELCSAAVDVRLPNLLSMNAGNKLWWGMIDVFFRTPYYYVKGSGMHVYEWYLSDKNQEDLYSIINSDRPPDKYKEYAEEFELLKGISREDYAKLLDGDHLHSVYGDDDPEMETKIYDAMYIVSEAFNVNENLRAIGKFGTDKKYEGELANGRQIKVLFSYAHVINNFDIKTFINNMTITIGNALLGNLREGEHVLFDSAENNIIRKKTIISAGIVTMFALFPGAMMLSKKINAFAKGRKRILNEIEAKREAEGDVYYELKRKYKGWREGVLDLYEYTMYTMLVYTALVEFVGLTNAVGQNKKLDTFISESYSSEWYYITQLAGLRYYQSSRQKHGLGYRNPDNEMQNRIMPIVTGLALETIIVIASQESVDSFLEETFGYKEELGGMGKIAATIAFFGFFMRHLGNYLYRSPYQTSSAIEDKLIETHAKLVKNKKTREFAKIMRHRLKHNKRFMKVAMSHISII